MRMKPPKKIPQTSSPDKNYEAGAPRRPPGVDSPANVVVSQQIRQQFSGPLPHPATLREYDEIVPGAAKEIIQSFTAEGNHRRARELREVAMCEDWARADIGLQKRGQILGFIIAVIGVGGGLYVAATGAPAAGAAVSSVSLAAIVLAFLRQRQMGSAEPEEDKAEKPAAKKG
jgi:uncharacterized membrane protein